MLAERIQGVQGSLFWEYRKILLIGLASNFSVFALAAVLAVAPGLVACLAPLSPFRALRWRGSFYAELFRNTPEYVLLFAKQNSGWAQVIDPQNPFGRGANTWAIRYGDPAWNIFLDMWMDNAVASGLVQQRHDHYFTELQAS
jgi:ABC-type amino acid transport system permease subunit